MKAQFSVEHDTKHNMVFLEDLANLTGGTTITNDAENVVGHCRSLYGNGVRVVYKGTDQEWFEIVAEDHAWDGLEISFKPWHGLVWDKLTKVEQ